MRTDAALPPSCRLARWIASVTFWRGVTSPSMPMRSNVSVPSSSSVCAVVPSLNCSGSTPMPTRLLRWMRSKLCATTARTPSRRGALRRPVARAAGAVFLAGEDDERHAFAPDTSSRRRRCASARRPAGDSVTPPSTPGTIRFLMRTLAKVPRVMTAIVAAARAVAVEVLRRRRRAPCRYLPAGRSSS